MLDDLVFVGGCTTGLFLTPVARLGGAYWKSVFGPSLDERQLFPPASALAAETSPIRSGKQRATHFSQGSPEGGVGF